MDQRICLDTDFSIEILKNSEKSKFLKKEYPKAEIYISTITLFELLLREKNLEEIETFISATNLICFDEISARKSSLIFKDLKEKGKIIDFKDIFIASCCLTNNCKLATFNKKHFQSIEGLKLV